MTYVCLCDRQLDTLLSRLPDEEAQQLITVDIEYQPTHTHTHNHTHTHTHTQ
jgi:hypothetical protein